MTTEQHNLTFKRFTVSLLSAAILPMIMCMSYWAVVVTEHQRRMSYWVVVVTEHQRRMSYWVVVVTEHQRRMSYWAVVVTEHQRRMARAQIKANTAFQVTTRNDHRTVRRVRNHNAIDCCAWCSSVTVVRCKR